MENSHKNLHIYKASAGSGKTFTLTYNYIVLLFKNLLHQNSNLPASSDILAVTFTNNASNEMKERILKALYKLSNGQYPNYETRLLNDSSFSGKDKLNSDKIKELAKQLCKEILHNYSFFYVETIDSFTQRILKSFAKDLQLQPKFNVELSTDIILDNVIKNLLVNSIDNEELHKIIIDFVTSDLEEGKTTSFKKVIKNESKKLFTELYQNAYPETITEDMRKDILSKIETFFKEQKEILSKEKECIKNCQDDLRKLLTDTGFSADSKDFTQKLRENILGKEPNISTVYNATQDNHVIWNGKKKYNPSLDDLFDDGFRCKLLELYNHLKEHNSAKLLLENQKGITLSHYVQDELDKYCREENAFILSFANKFLTDIIDGNSTPFVYEKIGQRIKHIMIDEFQDTSKLQWENFKPLVQNVLGENYGSSLIIGDVKQSIYRFRNGDWSLLHNLGNNDIFSQYAELNPLCINYRSKSNIIRFNNIFFNRYAQFIENNHNREFETDKHIITNIYKDIEQKLSEDSRKREQQLGGYVQVQFLPPQDDDVKLEHLYNTVIELFSRGWEPSDIVFLCYEKKHITEIVEYFQKKKAEGGKDSEKLEIISEEALKLENNKAVQFIITYLQLLTHPTKSDELAFIRSNLSLLYNQIHSKQTTEDISSLLGDEKFNNVSINTSNSLFAICEEIIYTFLCEEGTNCVRKEYSSYITDFQNIVYEYSKKFSASIPNFLEYWDEKKENTFLKQSNVNGYMSAYTVHKSKGLEYPIIIMPHLIKKLKDFPNLYQLSQTNEPKISYLKGNLTHTLFHDAYEEEILNQKIDNINAMYVACTRPVEELYIFEVAGAKQSNNEKQHITEIQTILKDSPTSENRQPNELPTYLGMNMEEKEKIFTYSLGNKGIKAEDKGENDQDTETLFVSYNVSYSNIDFAIDKKANNFIEQLESNPNRELGTLMHKIMEHIVTADDIERCVNLYCPIENVTINEKEKIKNFLTEKITDSRFNQWFTNDWDKIFTEQPILLPENIKEQYPDLFEIKSSKDKKELRPDRMLLKGNKITIIDYKFGEKKDAHKKQVKEYMNILSLMGYETEGFVWYVQEDNVMEVV